MSYRTILSYLPSEAAVEALVQPMAAWARRHDGHLTGLYVKPAMMPLTFTGYDGVDISGTMMEQHEAYQKELSDAVRGRFEAVMTSETFPHEWAMARSQFSNPVPLLTRFARAFEVVALVDDRSPVNRR